MLGAAQHGWQVPAAFLAGTLLAVACGNGTSSRANADASADVAAESGGMGGADASVIDASDSGGSVDAGGDALTADGSSEEGPVFEDAGPCSSQWAEWPMPNSPSSGLPNPSSYDTTSMPGVVIDNVTGLMWQRSVDANSYTWADAKAYCSSLTVAGESDWRLPTEIELVSLLSPTAPAIDPAAFPDAPSDAFWSASPLGGNASFAWAASSDAPGDAGFTGPYYSYTFYAYPGEQHRALCVRGPVPSAPPDHYTVANGTVIDHFTGLTWQRSLSSATYGPLLSDAEAYCNGLTLAGGGWRVPSLKELLTLVDFCVPEPGPTIDNAAFPDTPSSWFWSSSASTISGVDFYISGVDFYSGAATRGGDVFGWKAPVRCVR